MARCRRIFALLVFCTLLASPFVVSAATLTGSHEDIWGGTNNLSAEGTLDWGHWGLVTEFSYNHKSGVAQQIRYSFITDFVDYPNWDGPYRLDYRVGGVYDFSWTDGVPHRAIEDTSDGISIYGDRLQPGNTPAGFHIECPADTTPKTLRIYVGNAYGSAAFTASLDGASAYTDTYKDAPGNRVYTLRFQAGSPGQTLSVDFTSVDHLSYITLQAATLAGTNASPAVAITSPEEGAVSSAPATFALTASATDADGTVTNLSLFRGSTLVEQSASGTLNLTLSNQPAGAYDFLAVATDNCGLSATSFPVNVYVTINGGTLSGTVEPSPPAVDLTADGTADWAHWGLNSSDGFDHKSGVPQQISNLTLLNASTADLTTYSDSLAAYSWSDGTPTAAAVGTPTGIFLYATNPAWPGFQMTVPAASVVRQLKVYVGLSCTQGRLDAWLSDFSALPYSDSFLLETDNNGNAVYTFTFASANPGANLIVRWAPADVFNLLFGNVTWQAATLSGPPASPSPPLLRLVRPPPAPNQFALAFYAQAGVNYTVQCLGALGSTNWQTLTNLSGTGADVVVADSATGSSPRFYRVLGQ